MHGKKATFGVLKPYILEAYEYEKEKVNSSARVHSQIDNMVLT